MRRVGSITVIMALAWAAPALADDSPPGNLGNGLSRLIEPPAAKSGIRMTQAPLAIRDRQGRVLVDVYAEQGTPLPAVRDRAEQAGLQTVTQADDALEGYVALDDVNALAKAAGVASVSQALKPFTNVGATPSGGETVLLTTMTQGCRLPTAMTLGLPNGQPRAEISERFQR